MANDLIEVEVWPNGGGTGTVLTLASAGPDGVPPTQGKWQRNQTGTGEVTVPLDDPNVDLLVPGALLVWKVNGTRLRPVVRIEAVHDVIVGEGEEAAAGRNASGFGLLTEWDDALLHPTNGYDRRPFADRVVYDFSHPDFDDSSWHDTVYPILAEGDESPDYPVIIQRHTRPYEQPDQYAQWVATRSEDLATYSLPVGTMFFRRRDTYAADKIGLSYTSADDTFRELVDGVLVGKGATDPESSYTDTWRSANRLSAGEHVRAIEVTNYARFAGNVLNIAGLINSFFALDSLDDILVDDTFVSQTGTPPFTGDGWVCTDNFDDPTVRPGWTFGAMFVSAFTRAQAEGEMLQWELYFDAATDSNGLSWDLVTEFDFPTCGQLFADVLAKCVETHVDLDASIDLTTGVRRLYAYNKGTHATARTAALVTGSTSATPNVTALERHTDATSVIDRLAYRHANGFSKVEQDPAAGFPRRSGFLKAGGTQDPAEAQRIAELNMANLALPKTSLRAAEDTAGGDVPGIDFVPFDVIPVDGEDCVVDAISWSADQNGDAEWTPEFLDPIATAEERNDLALRRMALGTVGGRSESAAPAASDVDGISSGKMPKYRDMRFNFSGTAAFGRITGFFELKEARRLTSYTVTAQPQPDDSDIGPVSGPTTVNMYTADGAIAAWVTLPEATNWLDGDQPSYRVEQRLGAAFIEGTKFFCGEDVSGGHFNVVVEVTSTDAK